jgi:uncharacterized membrane protein (UPF0136 family)
MEEGTVANLAVGNGSAVCAYGLSQYKEAASLDFLFPIAIVLSTYLLFEIPLKKVKARKPIPMYLFIALFTSLLYGMNSILVVMYPKLEDPHFGYLSQFLNIAHHFLDLGMLYIPNNSFHVDLFILLPFYIDSRHLSSRRFTSHLFGSL